jgi:hypothetical protein
MWTRVQGFACRRGTSPANPGIGFHTELAQHVNLTDFAKLMNFSSILIKILQTNEFMKNHHQFWVYPSN